MGVLSFAEITGSSSECPSTSGTYSYNTDLSNPSQQWSITGGNMVISGPSTGSSVTFNFLSNFNGGQLMVSVTSNGHRSTNLFNISKCVPSCTPPTPGIDVTNWNVVFMDLTPVAYTLKLELNIDEKCSDFIKYELQINSSIRSLSSDGRNITVGAQGTLRTTFCIKVRGVYQSGTSNWKSIVGRTEPGPDDPV
ncbi:hypothetical protein [Xanthovirga aplysinae]|uniref:hypothetical protein n=1 Tax=Xanthovirga aplysinae TaxID=2529853 RepID=UPI0012BC343A|nr:hypothetical protein [Xanthovirga aplysinae]MTI29706.1 hypothetical protein [Xanthovirga aplysinae]